MAFAFGPDFLQHEVAGIASFSGKNRAPDIDISSDSFKDRPESAAHRRRESGHECQCPFAQRERLR